MPGKLALAFVGIDKKDRGAILKILEREVDSFSSGLIDSIADFKESITASGLDAILFDITSEEFVNEEILQLRTSLRPTLPCLILTDQKNVENALKCISLGADDYLLKNDLARLPHSLGRAIEKRHLQMAKLKAETQFRKLQYEVTHQEKNEDTQDRSAAFEEQLNNVLFRLSELAVECENSVMLQQQAATEIIYLLREYSVIGCKIIAMDREYISEPFEDSLERVYSPLVVNNLDYGKVILYFQKDEFPGEDFEPKKLCKTITNKLQRIIEFLVSNDRLRSRLNQLESVLAHQEEFFILVDKSGNIVYSNHDTCEFLSDEDSNLLGKRFIKLFPGNEAKQISEAVSKPKPGEWNSFLLKIPSDGKPKKEISISFTPWMETGKQAGLQFVLKEISSETSEVTFSDPEFQKIIQTVTDCIYLFEPSGKIVDVNASAVKAHGFTKEEMLEMNIRQLLPKSDHQIFVKFKQLAAKGEKLESPVTLLKKNGSTFEGELHGLSIERKEKEFLLAAVQDLTSLKEVQKARAWMRQSLNTAPVSVVITSKEGRFIWANNHFYSLFHYKRTEVEKQSITRFFTLATGADTNFKDLLTMGLRGETTALQAVDATKESFPAYVFASEVLDDSKALLGYVFIVVDQREMRELEEEKNQLEHEIRRQFHLTQMGLLTSTVVHNLGTPIDRLFTKLSREQRSAEDILNDQAENSLSLYDALENASHGFYDVEREAKRIQLVLDDLIDYQRMSIDAGEAVSDLSRVVRAEASLLRNELANSDGLQLILEPSPVNVPVRATSHDIGHFFYQLTGLCREALLESKSNTMKVRVGSDPTNNQGWFEIETVKCTLPDSMQEVLKHPEKVLDSKEAENMRESALDFLLMNRFLKYRGGSYTVSTVKSSSRIRIRLPMALVTESEKRS